MGNMSSTTTHMLIRYTKSYAQCIHLALRWKSRLRRAPKLSSGILCSLEGQLLHRRAAEAVGEAASLQGQLKELEGLHEGAAAERDALQLECANLRTAVSHLESVITSIYRLPVKVDLGSF